MIKEFTYASGFAGIGGMTMGLAPLGGIGVAAWEFDPTEKKTQYAQEAHKLLHPSIPIYGNICDFDASRIPDFDLFCFTPPCQAFSIAGARGGFEDTRGTLTFEALRIAKEKKPKVLFIENVKGLVNHDSGSSLGTIIHAINEIGYLVDFKVLNSKHFGVAQNRERVYLVAVREDLIEQEVWDGIRGNTLVPKAKRRYQLEGARAFNFDWPKEHPESKALIDFLEESVDSKYYLSKEKTAELSEKIRNYYEELEGVNSVVLDSSQMRGDINNIRVFKDICPTITAREYKDPRAVGSVVRLGKLREHRSYSLANTIHGVEGISYTLDTMQGGAREPKICETYNDFNIRKLTPRECLRLQAVPEHYIDIILSNFSDSRAYKFAGNGLTTTVIATIGEKILKYL